MSDNPFAFPIPVNFKQAGMTLRYYFAGQSLEAIAATAMPSLMLTDEGRALAAKQAYQLADAMLTERAKQP